MSTITSTKPAPAATEAAKPAAPVTARKLPLTSAAKSKSTRTAPAKPASKASATKEAATELRTNAARNAERAPDLGDYKEGDKVATADGREWVVVGPAQGNTTLKLTRKAGDKTESVFRFARNISRVGK
jgi:hypothetical protein